MNIIRKLFKKSVPCDFETITEQISEKTQEMFDELAQKKHFYQQLQEEIEKLAKLNEESCIKAGTSPETYFADCENTSFRFILHSLLIDSECVILQHSKVLSYIQQKLIKLPFPTELKFGCIKAPRYSSLLLFKLEEEKVKSSPDFKYFWRFDPNYEYECSQAYFSHLWYIENNDGYFAVDLHETRFIYFEKRYWNVEPLPPNTSFDILLHSIGTLRRHLLLKLNCCYDGNTVVPKFLHYSIESRRATIKKPDTIIDNFNGNEDYTDILKAAQNWKNTLVQSQFVTDCRY